MRASPVPGVVAGVGVGAGSVWGGGGLARGAGRGGGGSMFSPTFAQGMMLAELNASRAREQSERESQARFLGFMGVPK